MTMAIPAGGGGGKGARAAKGGGGGGGASGPSLLSQAATAREAKGAPNQRIDTIVNRANKIGGALVAREQNLGKSFDSLVKTATRKEVQASMVSGKGSKAEKQSLLADAASLRAKANKVSEQARRVTSRINSLKFRVTPVFRARSR